MVKIIAYVVLCIGATKIEGEVSFEVTKGELRNVESVIDRAKKAFQDQIPQILSDFEFSRLPKNFEDLRYEIKRIERFT